jgi:CYTH domain-containing protein
MDPKIAHFGFTESSRAKSTKAASGIRNRAASFRDAGEPCQTVENEDMSSEIERKFLLAEQPAWLSECSGVRIEQGYLAVEEDVEVRLRRADEELLLTVKRGHGEVREEVEVALEREQFEALWPLTESRRLRKTRRLVPIEDGLTAEVDVFEAGLEGLVVGEVEFGSREDSESFAPPAWLGEEITGDGRYSGQSLALQGRPRV